MIFMITIIFITLMGYLTRLDFCGKMTMLLAGESLPNLSQGGGEKECRK